MGEAYGDSDRLELGNGKNASGGRPADPIDELGQFPGGLSGGFDGLGCEPAAEPVEPNDVIPPPRLGVVERDGGMPMTKPPFELGKVDGRRDPVETDGDLAVADPKGSVIARQDEPHLAQPFVELIPRTSVGEGASDQGLDDRDEAVVVGLDEPTRGVDVGAIAEIHSVINELADSGLPVVMISSYLPEILSLSDRILVSRLGRVVEEFSIEEATEEKIMYAAVH